MTAQKMIAEQLKRIEKLQKEFQAPKPGQEDIKIADELKATRAQTLRKTLHSLERQKTETAARFDAEIASVKDRIAALEKPGELDFAQQISGGKPSPTPATKRKPGTRRTKKS